MGNTTTFAEIAFATGVANPGTRDIAIELGPRDISRYDAIEMTAVFTKAIADAGDICQVYLQMRGQDGVWQDRVALPQMLGNLAPSPSAPEILRATVAQFGTLADAEEVSEPYGSAGAAHQTTGTVRNGPFPGKYRTSEGWLSSARIVLSITDADNDSDFEGTIYLAGN